MHSAAELTMLDTAWNVDNDSALGIKPYNWVPICQYLASVTHRGINTTRGEDRLLLSLSITMDRPIIEK